jgi:tripartite-type tricarboxylate transporter receptor subunit TctC
MEDQIERGMLVMKNKVLKNTVFIVALTVLSLVLAGQNTVQAASAADFYKGKVVECIVPYKTGGGYDAWVRTISPFFKKYTGATMVINNVPGAGSLVGTNKIYFADPSGLTIGIINGVGALLAQVTDVRGVKYDLPKYSWLARVTAEERAVVAGKKSKFQSLEAMEKATTPVKIGAPGMGSSNFYEAVLIMEALGIKIDIITGYETESEVTMAIMRNEVDAEIGSFSSIVDTVKRGDLVAVMHYGALDMPELAKVPKVSGLPIRTKDGKELLSIVFALEDVGRAMVAPPGIPADRQKFLEEALKKCLEDPTLRSITKKQNMEIAYLSGSQAKQLAQKGLALSSASKGKIKEATGKYAKF